jgi:hypothetical protein
LCDELARLLRARVVRVGPDAAWVLAVFGV